MNPITHFLIGWTVASSDRSLNKQERTWVTLASVAPDLDGLGIVAEWATRHAAHPLTWWTDYHHVLGHNLWFALLLSAVAAGSVRQRLKVGLLVFVSFHAHLLGDLVGARGPDGDHWPIPYLSPFSRQLELSWAHQWALNAWPNILITASLLLLALTLARRRGYSPLEVFSTRGDEVLVAAIRKRFPCENQPGA